MRTRPEASETEGVQSEERAERAERPAWTSPSAAFAYKRRVRAYVTRNLPQGVWGPGRVVVGFRLSPTGKLLSASVTQSSGNPQMDRAALACVRTAGPYPKPPAGSTPSQRALSIDFRFQ
jgi:protein TonB